MKEKNQRDSRKRLNALILLVAFTAILLIVSTYAWFSTQKNVTLSGLDGKVNVAEGLQISLDAKNWANEIDLSTTGIAKYFATDNVGKEDNAKLTLKNPYAGRENFVPSELLPVSTTAQAVDTDSGVATADGIGLTDFNMYRGVNTSGIKLDTITNITTDSTLTTDKKGYFAIDLFLMNSSAEAAIGKDDDGQYNAVKDVRDALRLESNSSIDLKVKSKESTGVQNSFRVAFALFDEADALLVGDTPNQQQILDSVNGKNITDVTIWEPNASGAEVKSEDTVTRYAAHVDYIVQNNNRLTFDATQGNTAPTSGYANGKFTADAALPTYALTAKSLTAKELKDKDDSDLEGSIKDIYNCKSATTTANGLTKQTTVQTSNKPLESVVPLTSIKKDTPAFSIRPGRYVKLRMYVWLEGQDVDCINYASLGGGMTINVGLSKAGTQE